MIKETKIPLWLLELLPQPSIPQTIDYSPELGLFKISLSTGETITCETIEDTYHKAHESSEDIEFTPAFKEVYGSSPSIPIEGSTSVYMFMAYTDENRLERLEDAYQFARESEEKYLEDKTNFVNAWSFINNHPAFWLNPDFENNPWYWQCSNGVALIEQYVYFDEDSNSTHVMLDTGARNPNPSPNIQAHSTRYADWRLEVTENSYEEAFISLAERVWLCFNSDGSLKPLEDFPYPEPAWIKEVAERIENE